MQVCNNFVKVSLFAILVDTFEYNNDSFTFSMMFDRNRRNQVFLIREKGNCTYLSQ